MLKIGLTGNIGSGKSVCSKIFALLGIAVYNADTEAKKLYSNPIFKAKVINLFGTSILTSDAIDKAKLAAIVFKDNTALEKLNAIIHPEVLNNFKLWCNAQSKEMPYVVHEAAIIYEHNLESYFDKIIVVNSAVDIRIKRIIKRDGLSETDILNRMEKQLSDAEKCKKADYIINNNDKELLIPQIITIHNSILYTK